jgi:hypothetical protein
MMRSVELLVSLKIPDVTALTAANVLRRRMGYADSLKELKRADYYRLDLNCDTDAEAIALAEELAVKTNEFVNPNKHVFTVRLPSRGDDGAAASNGVHTAHVLVTDPTDGSAEGIVSALTGRLGYGGKVQGVLRGMLWTLKLACESDEQAQEMAKAVAITEARDRGLLMNPHFQECEVW